MVVDHEEMMRDLMQQALAQDAQEVLTEANGEEAMFILVREHIDLIISEVVRPEMAGIYRESQTRLSSRPGNLGQRLSF